MAYYVFFMKKSLSTILLLIITLSFAFGQGGEPLSTKNKKAAKYYESGMSAFNVNDFDNARAEFTEALKEDSTFVEAHFMLGYVYMAKDYNTGAILQFKKAIAISPNFYPNVYFTLGRLEVGEGNYSEALQFLQIFQKHGTSDEAMKLDTRFFINDCYFGANAIKHPVPFDPKNMGPSINSDLWEYFPSLTGDGETFLFTRKLDDAYSEEGSQEDLYVSYKVNGEWTQAVNMGKPLNTPHFNEGAPTLSADGHLLIYASNMPGGYGSVDLYYSVKQGDNWSQGVNLGKPVNSANWESQPCLSTDGRSLYFVRGKRHDSKTMDIYLTQLSDSGTWSIPERLSDTINTPGTDCYPFIAADNQTLYFCSDGHPGMGGIDIFMSRRLPNGRWGIPKNLGYPINSPKDETSIVVDPNGKLAYFSSDRKGGYGGQDIYDFELYDSVRPTPVTYMKGKVYDAKTNVPLVANFTLTDLATGNVQVSSMSAPDGTFLVCLPLTKNYALDVSRKGYLFYSEHFSLQDVKADAAHPYLMNIPLQPIDTGAMIVLKNIFYETDKYDLKPESHIELNKVISFLNTNPTVKIEISGHTDNTGSVQHNIVLSKNRAKSVYDYLIAHGISADRLTYKGYGQSVPIADNGTIEGRAQNRRTEMKIIGK